MKISIVAVRYSDAATIRDTIDSVFTMYSTRLINAKFQ